MGWRRTTQRFIENGELIRPVAESLPQHDAIALYTRQGAPQRPGSEALLGWLREVLSDAQVAEATGLALDEVAKLRTEGKR